jgi:hypothetical protein
MNICFSHHNIIREIITRSIMKIIKAYFQLPHNSIFKISILGVSDTILLYLDTHSFSLLLKLLSLIYNLITYVLCYK